jgi:hypothetical protein
MLSNLSKYALLRMTEKHYEQDFYYIPTICELSEEINWGKFVFPIDFFKIVQLEHSSAQI